jgi:hypothetical protein
MLLLGFQERSLFRYHVHVMASRNDHCSRVMHVHGIYWYMYLLLMVFFVAKFRLVGNQVCTSMLRPSARYYC